MHFVRRLAQITDAPPAAMPGIEKLPIEETLEDSPQVTALFPGGFSWQANVSHLAYTARLTVFVDTLFANNQRIDAKFTQLANR